MSSTDPIRSWPTSVAGGITPEAVGLWPRGGPLLAITRLAAVVLLLIVSGCCFHAYMAGSVTAAAAFSIFLSFFVLNGGLSLVSDVVRCARKRPDVTLDREGIHLVGRCCTRITWQAIGEIRIHRPWGARATVEVVAGLTPEFVRQQGPWDRFCLALRRGCGSRQLVIRLGGLAKPADEVAALLRNQRDAWLSHAFA